MPVSAEKFRLFVSSVQKELAAERRAVKERVQRDPVLRRFFEVFLFEDLAAAGRRADEVFLTEVDHCDVYVGLFGDAYGFEDAKGVSPTEREFDRATVAGKERLVFVRGANDERRHPKMRALIRKAGDQVVRRRFSQVDELLDAVAASLADFLERRGAIQSRPFDERVCPGATLADIDAGTLTDFVRRARGERKFPLPETAGPTEVLSHLEMLAGGVPTHAAILLFGKNPQRFLPCAEVRCMHFHGTDIVRPAPYYRIFKGGLFGQVDAAVNFVLSVVNFSVGTRAASTQAPVRPELPPEVVREAVVNAIAHRDYASAAAVQVSVFSDRVEIWNPGELSPPLTLDGLRRPHHSIARNARVCEALFLARYIEKYGTGTLMMIRESVGHGLSEPGFALRPGEFVATVWRDWLTAETVAALGLNERQLKAVARIRTLGRLTNREYRALTGASERTAVRDLTELIAKGLLARRGETGRAAHYAFAPKPAINPPNPPSLPAESNPPQTSQTRHVTKGRKSGGAARARPCPQRHRKK
jgi:predicted HTH transcriptional regulator